MKLQYPLVALLLTLSIQLMAQPGKKTTGQPPASGQPDMNKLLEEAMKAEGMSKEEQEAMKKMMKDVMPAMNEVNAKTADYPEFKNNLQLIPRKDPARIAMAARKALTKAEVQAYANNLYSKISTRGNPAEMALVKKVIAASPKATDLASASFLAMLQGHPQAALALSIKAVATDPGNLNWQNNMAALLTSYGYPEQAMPLLRKLRQDIPVNSTVLNNTGYAWLGLGETDSAGKYFTAAIRVNPRHPESKSGKGLTEEAAGRKENAAKEYRESMENVVNPYADQLLKNNEPAAKPKPIDLEKLKATIPYYEYFREDWMGTLPVLSNNVYRYAEDKATKKAYMDMMQKVTDKVNGIIDRLDDDLDNLTKKGEDEFVKQMTFETMKGLNMMSKPAVMVIGVLGAYMAQWQEGYSKETLELTEWKRIQVQKRDEELAAIYKKIQNTKGATCKQFKYQLDSVENGFMRTVNGRVREFLVRRADEIRHWANMYVSWNWYVAGNVKNMILLQDHGFAGTLAEMMSTIVTAMETRHEHCVDRFEEIPKTVPAPEFPNFDCRPVMSVPAGPEWEELLAGVKDFDDNRYGIKKTDEPVPNVSAAYGMADLLAEPALAPFVKTADGSVSPANYVNPDDLESSYYADEKWVPTDPDGKPYPEEDVWGEKRRTSRMIRELLGNMIQSDCKTLKSSKDALREALARKKEAMREKIYNQTNELNKYTKLGNEIQEQRVRELVDQGKRAIEKFINDKNIDHYYDNLDRLINTLTELEYFNSPRAQRELETAIRTVSATQQDAWEMKIGTNVLNKIEQQGIQVSVSNGLQTPGTFTPQKGLFQ